MRPSVCVSTADVGSTRIEDLGVGEDGARQAQALALTSRETSSPFFDDGGQSVVEGVEHVQRARRVQDRVDALVVDRPWGMSS